MAVSSKAEVLSLAISLIGSGKQVANFDSEETPEARAGRAFYDLALESVLTDFDWGFARRRVALELIETDPNDEWSYSYRCPLDYINALSIYNGESRPDTRDNYVPFEIGGDNAGKIIFTDMEDAVLKYTCLPVNIAKWTSGFAMTVAYRLAIYILPRLSKGDLFKIKAQLFSEYQAEASQAMRNDSNEGKPDQPFDSEFILARN